MEGLYKYLYCLMLLSLTPQGLGAVGTCSSSCQFVPGPPGRDGLDGIPGNPGAPGTFSYSDYLRLKEELLTELRQQLLQELREQSAYTLIPTGQSQLCSLGLTEDNPASSCADILQCNPEATSQNYWIQTTNGSRLMYCHMEEDKCGVRGVMRVVNINMTNPEETCPSPLTLYMANGTRVCGPTNPNSLTCTSVTFPTFNYQYSHVCGRAAGFSYYNPCAFQSSQPGKGWTQTLDGAYVSGLSITHSAPGSRTHIWTYAGGLQESISSTCNCPYAKYPGQSPPSYVGEHYSTARVLHSIPLLTHLVGIPTIPYGTMRTVIQEAIAVIPHVLLGL